MLVHIILKVDLARSTRFAHALRLFNMVISHVNANFILARAQNIILFSSKFVGPDRCFKLLHFNFIPPDSACARPKAHAKVKT